MDKKQIINTICQNYLHLTPDCIEELSLCAKVLTLDKEIEIVKEGQYADKIYYIAQGVARAYYLKDGRDISDWFAFDKDFISSIKSYFLDVPSPHFIETIKPTILLEIDRENVNRLSDKYREFDKLVKLVITRTMLKLQQRIASMQFETAQQKYENLVMAIPDIALQIPVKHIASYLGITIETLSRIRSSRRRI